MEIKFKESLWSLIWCCFWSSRHLVSKSSVASPAGVELLNVILLHEPGAQFGLRFRGHVTHLCDLVARPQVLLRIAVAVETPAHLQRRILIGQGLLVDAAVAGLAADAFSHMDAVV